MDKNYQEKQKDPIVRRNKTLVLKIKRKILSHVWFVRGLFLGSLILILYIGLTRSFGALKDTKIISNLSLVKHFLLVPEGILKSYEGRTNVLILGKSGGSHEAPDLTDSIMFVSISKNNKDVTLISLSRDIWIPNLRTKLNSVYYWGNKRQTGGGMILAKATAEEIVGQPVHYAMVVDFEGFTGIIDLLGGVEVNVERGFTDSKFPISGKEDDLCNNDPEFKCRYETVSFESGKQLMDGQLALKFARSRNAQGEEGTDFARAARQQQILYSIKNKILSFGVLASPGKIKGVKKVIYENIESDFQGNQAALLAGLIFRARNNIRSYILPEELLINPLKSDKYDNLYVFIPKGNDWMAVKDWVDVKLD